MTSIRIQSGARSWAADTAEGARVFRVGRDEGSDIVATDSSVSRRHAEIRSTGDGWEVVDVGSTLGTWIEGRRVERHTLHGTTTVGLGDQGRSFQLTISVSAASPPAPSSYAAPSPYAAPGGPGGPAAPPAPQAPQAPAGQGWGAPVPPTAPYPVAQAPQAPQGPQTPFTPAGPPAPKHAAPHPGQPGQPGQPAYAPANPLLEQTVVISPAGGGFGGPGLLVRRRVGGDLRFPGGVPVRIGRDPVLEVHADDQAVSRLHAVVEPRPDGWWWVDRSTSGTFVDGERVTSFKLDEPTEISLGHPTAGYEIEVVPVVAAREAAAGIQRRKRRRALVVAAAAVALLLAAGGITWGVVALVGDDPAEIAGGGPGAGTPQQQAQALERAKAAAVLLQAVDDSGQVMWSGSGSIVSDDGLILTNAHVGDPDAEGQGSSEDDPAYLEVSLTTGDDDEPAKATYRAKPIVSDGYLDFAVLQIEADIDGTEVDPADLDLPEPLPIGDSDQVRTGDRIRALGYPAIGNLAATGDRPLTVTEGVVSTFQADPIVGTERGSIDSDVRLGSGNSGGPSINDAGEIIGLNTRVITADSVDAGSITQGSALIVPVNLAEAVLDIARDGGDPDYVSPYLDKLPKDPGLPTDAVATPHGWATEEGGECQGTTSEASPQQLSGVKVGDTLQAEFTLEGVPSGLPLSVDFLLADGSRVDTLSGTWDGDEAATCISAPLVIQGAVPGLTAVLSLGQDGQVVAKNPVEFPDLQ